MAAVNFGRNASTTKMIPTQTPTTRAATPVSSAMEMLIAYVLLGTVPARPERRLPRPSANRAPCTERKSMARGLRHETRWTAMVSPRVSMAPTSVTNTNAGRSAQKAGPKPRSNPTCAKGGRPTHAASTTLAVS